MKNEETPDFSTRFRLRKDERIVGHMKVIHGLTFYSTDAYAWSGNEIEYFQKDEFTGYFDKNKKALYSEDIVSFSTYPQKLFILHFDSALNTFYAVDFSSLTTLDLNLIELFSSDTTVTHVAYSFNYV